MKRLIILFTVLFFTLDVSAFDHNHTAFHKILATQVVDGKVNYKGLKSNATELENYLKTLSAVTPSEYNGFTKEQKLAFLINAYNGFTIKLILDNYPVKSIKKIGGIFSNPWKIEFFSLLGAKRNLDWIEHSKLRVDFEEPRIHFAIVCASIGCPSLLSEAFVVSKLETQLQTQKDNFLKDKTKNRFDSTNNTLYLSPIFDWFSQDFTKKTTLVDFVKSSMGSNIPANAKIKYTDYDWNLNEK